MSSMPDTMLLEVPAQVVGKYRLGKVLGAGDFDCRIRLCTHVVSGIEYAVKIYDKDVLQEHLWAWEQIRGSIQVMRTLPKHDHLVEMVECFETEKSLYILMQFVNGDSLLKAYLNRQTAKGKAIVEKPMNYTKAYFAQIVFGIAHLHANNVVHLGLAPDHIIINSAHIAKIGFLVSCSTHPKGKRITMLRGTTTTVAPEVLEQVPYDPYQAEMWSLGVVLYFMLSGGRYPFDGANTAKMILKRKIRPLNPNLPEDAKDVVGKLLRSNPAKRMTLEQLLEHPFFITSAQLAVQLVETLNPTMCPRTIPPTSVKLSQSYVSSSMTEGTVQIRLPKGLEEADEAAFIIQHTWRLTRSSQRPTAATKQGSVASSTTEANSPLGPPSPPKPGIMLTPDSSPRLSTSILLTPSATLTAPTPPREDSGHFDEGRPNRTHSSNVNDVNKFFRSTSIYFDQMMQSRNSASQLLRESSVSGANDSRNDSDAALQHSLNSPHAAPFCNVYKCPACGRLPPPRLTGTKAPYPNAKVKYNAGKFEDVEKKRTSLVPTPPATSATSGLTSPRSPFMNPSPRPGFLPTLPSPRKD